MSAFFKKGLGFLMQVLIVDYQLSDFPNAACGWFNHGIHNLL